MTGATAPAAGTAAAGRVAPRRGPLPALHFARLALFPGPSWRGGRTRPIVVPMAKADDTVADLGFYKAVGARVRELRAAAGMTQDALAAATGMNPDFVWRVEAGRQNLSLKTIGRLALALDVPLTAFFEGISPDAAVMEPRRAASTRSAASDGQ